MENTVVIVPGLFGGMSSEYYQPLVETLGVNDFLIFRAGSDWEPTEIAREIKQIEGHKQIVCLSCGAMVGNLLARDKDTEVFYLCPYLGVDFLNRRYKAYAYRLRHVFKALASILMIIAKPFRRHRWYPLWGGTKPDGWFLSSYAIMKQLWYAFSETPALNTVDGTVFSYGDNVVEPDAAARTSANAIPARTVDSKGPSHVNLRAEDKKFGSITTSQNDKLSDDAKAYLTAFAKVLTQT